jgi:NADH:ubiquinone oxidoreductase subunit F (NADH-binding)
VSAARAMRAAGAAGRAHPPSGLPRLIPPGGPLPLGDHVARYGPVPFRETRGRAGGFGAAELTAEVERAGLTGRGGAGFPTGRKMRTVAEAGRKGGPLRGGAGAVVVANGAESEPASGKDRLLLARAPHLVLDGIALAAEAVGAGRGYLVLHEGQDELALQLAAAVDEREHVGQNRAPVRVVTVPRGYVASQETAVISQLNGGAPKPAFVPPRPFEKGAHGRPTLVQNVETLAHVALIARFGTDWFRDLGPADPGAAGAGSALVTVSGAVSRPGVYEIALGMPIGELVRWAGGPSEPPQAILAGGYFGGWLPYDRALGVPVSDPALRAAGAALGPGVLVVLPESACGLAETAWIAGFLATQSAGQCGPCLNGLPALADMLEQLAFGRPDRRALGWAQRLLTLVTRRGACHLPDGAAAFVASGLATFADELRQHSVTGPCARVRRRPVLPAPGYDWGRRP